MRRKTREQFIAESFRMLGTLLIGVSFLLSPLASAASPTIYSTTVVIGKGDRKRGTTRVHHPLFALVKVEGIDLGSTSDGSIIRLFGWSPRNGEVREISRRIQSKRGWRTKGSSVLEWNSSASILVVFDISRTYHSDEQVSDLYLNRIEDIKIEVQTPEGTTGPTPPDLAFQYDRWSLNQPPNAIALAQGDNGDVYINYEINAEGFDVWRADTETVQAIDVPKTETTGPFGEPDGNTWANGNGQDVVFGDGRAWFGQSGNWEYHSPEILSQSRIVSYDPAAPEGQRVKKYVVAADDEPIMGLLYDSIRNRLWYSTGDPLCLSSTCKAAIGYLDLDPTKLMQVELGGSPPAPIRLWRSSLSQNTPYPVKMTLDGENNLWFNAFGGNFLGRITVNSVCDQNPNNCTIDHYRIPRTFIGPEFAFGVGGWSIDTLPDGDIVFSTQFDLTLGRFDWNGNDSSPPTLGRNDPVCESESGAAEDENECMKIVQVPVAGGVNTDELLHTMAVDEHRCLLWYTYYTGDRSPQYKHNSVGFVPFRFAGGSEAVTKLPALFPFETSYLWGVTNLSGIIVGNDGSVFFSDFSRDEGDPPQLKRLKPLAPYMVDYCP